MTLKLCRGRKSQNLWANTAKVLVYVPVRLKSFGNCLSSSNSETQTASIKRYVFKNYA